MKKTLRLLSIALAIVMMASVFTACGGNTGASQTPTPTATPGKTPAPASTEPTGSTEPDSMYPLVESHTFTCWWRLENDINTVLTTLNENHWFIYMKELTGVDIQFTHPTKGGETEAYNLMIASDLLTDFIREIGTYHSRGLDDAVESGIIYDMRDYMQYMPNYEKMMNENDDRMIQSMTDQGRLAGLAMLISRPQTFVNGMMVRKDWLTKYNIQMPETINQFEQMLTTFRDNEPGAKNGPLWMNDKGQTGLFGSFDINTPTTQTAFMYRDGKVRATVLEPGFRTYVETMADWYQKKLIWQDFVSDSGIIPFFNSRPKVANGEFGAIYDCFVYVDEYNSIGVGDDYEIAPMPAPVKEAGGKIHTLNKMRYASAGALGITTKCADVELACKYWDYGYSDEGYIRANYGEEGVTMFFDGSGHPQYSEFALHNPDGMTFYQVQNYYMIQNAPFHRVGARELDGISDAQKACEAPWTENGDSEYSLPSITLTAEEGSTRARIMSDIETLILENLVRFIMGEKPMSEFDAFIDQIKSMGIEDVCALYEAALTRYQNRGK